MAAGWRFEHCLFPSIYGPKVPENKLLRIRNDEGIWKEEPTWVKQTVEKHFKNLFTFDCQRDWGDILSCLDPVVTTEMNRMLYSPILDMEIKETVFNMGGTKALGPNGFQGIFFQSFWDMIAVEVKGLVADYLLCDGYHSSLNSTNIVLFFMVLNPEVVNHFQPISLCNYSYKVLSKILAN